MKTVGTELNKIPNRQFLSFDTEYAEDILEKLSEENIRFFAKYDENKLNIAVSKDNIKTVSDVFGAFSNEKSDTFIDSRERIPNEVNTDEITKILPEISKETGLSVSTLRDRPMFEQALLAKTYINCIGKDNIDLKNELSKIIDVRDTSPEVTASIENITDEKEKPHAKEKDGRYFSMKDFRKKPNLHETQNRDNEIPEREKFFN